MNLYLTLPAAKRALQMPTANTDHDTLLMELIESESRNLDAFCRRHFFSVSETRRFVPEFTKDGAYISDLLELETVSVVDPRDALAEEVEFAESDIQLWPENGYPKMRINLYSSSSLFFVPVRSRIVVEGIFGYGDGTSDPWMDAGATATVATTTGTAVTLSALGSIEQGHTIKVGTEQMFIRSISSLTATVKRGVNGTTAADHSAVAAKIALYPAQIKMAVAALVGSQMNSLIMAGQQTESIDGHSVSMMSEDQRLLMMNRICSGHARGC